MRKEIMKTWLAVVALALAFGCLAPRSHAADKSAGTQVRSNLLAMLKTDMPEAKISASNREFNVVVQWMTQTEAQTCQRPLDLYLADSRIGAFIHPIQNLTLKRPSLHDLAHALRPSVVVYLKEKRVPESRVLAAKDIAGVYTKDDAEPATPPYSEPAARSPQR